MSRADLWGPFCPDLSDAERAARSRCLAALVFGYAGGPRAAPALVALRRLEMDAAAAAEALAAFDALPSIGRRRALVAFAAVMRHGGAG